MLVLDMGFFTICHSRSLPFKQAVSSDGICHTRELNKSGVYVSLRSSFAIRSYDVTDGFANSV